MWRRQDRRTPPRDEKAVLNFFFSHLFIFCFSPDSYFRCLLKCHAASCVIVLWRRWCDFSIFIPQKMMNNIVYYILTTHWEWLYGFTFHVIILIVITLTSSKYDQNRGRVLQNGNARPGPSLYYIGWIIKNLFRYIFPIARRYFIITTLHREEI